MCWVEAAWERSMEVLLGMNDACWKKHGGDVKQCLKRTLREKKAVTKKKKEESRSQEKSRRWIIVTSL